MPNTPVTESQLCKGTVIRFQNSIFAKGKMTVRITDDRSEVRPVTQHGNVYAIVYGYRVRPNDYSVSFGNKHVYCINVNNIEVVQEA